MLAWWQAARFGEMVTRSVVTNRLAKFVIARTQSPARERVRSPELRRGAAECAGQRRGDLGCYDLLGRFFWRHFFAGRR
jgi:hypothetical protein